MLFVPGDGEKKFGKASAGTLGIDGKIYDIPHFKVTQRTLAGA